MSEHTQMKGSGKSRHLPIGNPGSCLTVADSDSVFDATDLSGPECRRCRVAPASSRVVHIRFTISSDRLATVLDVARSQAAAAFDCVDDDPALVVKVGTGHQAEDQSVRYDSDWLFVVDASWDTEMGTPQPHSAAERRGRLDRRTLPDRRT